MLKAPLLPSSRGAVQISRGWGVAVGVASSTFLAVSIGIDYSAFLYCAEPVDRPRRTTLSPPGVPTSLHPGARVRIAVSIEQISWRWRTIALDLPEPD